MAFIRKQTFRLAIKKSLIVGIRFYKKFRPAFTVGKCIYIPSCTEYAVEAIERHGSRKGLILTLQRLKRCNGYKNSCGFDPVP